MSQINHLKLSKIFFILLIMLLLQISFIFSTDKSVLIEKQLKNIEWYKIHDNSNGIYGSSTIKIVENKIIYIDPIGITEETAKVKADYIFISHLHGDHLDIKSILLLRKKNTTIISNPEIIRLFSGKKFKKMFKQVAMLPNDKKTIDKLIIETFPAYNTSHPKEDQNLGFVITLPNQLRFYISGDTDFIPEMNNIKDIDIAILNVKSAYTLDGINAIKTISIIKPKIVIPVHWVDYEQKEIDYIQKNINGDTKLVVLKQK